MKEELMLVKYIQFMVTWNNYTVNERRENGPAIEQRDTPPLKIQEIWHMCNIYKFPTTIIIHSKDTIIYIHQ